MNKIYSMLGLASKAGKLFSGEDVVRNAIRYNKIKLLIISQDASENTKKRFVNAAEYYKVPMKIWGDKEQLGSSIGKSNRSVVGIGDENFTNSIVTLLNAENPITPIGEKSGGELNE
ncbi:MAG TPA: ribosomal L7Ae/L30e/S12e/Gadd45 family protein [Patescibacteria group bacterium]|nr:ribosomal L7Ae/L30e/S12e/Gadd45 family protein [Patescibacteria group bacterium]